MGHIAHIECDVRCGALMCAVKVSNALYDVRIAERCVDSRADSPWVDLASAQAPPRCEV